MFFVVVVGIVVVVFFFFFFFFFLLSLPVGQEQVYDLICNRSILQSLV
jgi:hypothetical protein